MEGCEKHCTFCVVPVTRGRQRSHPPAAVLAEIRGLADEGCREVTLLGQTVEMYGRDLTPATDLAALLAQVERASRASSGSASRPRTPSTSRRA